MMCSGMGAPALGVVALVLSTALLVWVSGKGENPAKKIGVLLAWVSVVISVLLIIGQVFVCARNCSGGMCMRGMGAGGPMGMGMMPGMRQGMGRGQGMGGMMQMPPPPPQAEDSSEKAK